MNRILGQILLAALLFGLTLPQLAAQQDIIDDSGVIDLNNICHPGGVGQDDGCSLEGVSVIYSDTTPTNLHTLSETGVSLDSFDDGFYAFVCTAITQDSTQLTAGCIGDNGQGVAGLVGNIPINLAGSPYSYAVDTTHYYDYLPDGGCENGGTCLAIVSTAVDVTLGVPQINSTSPPYVFVGTSGTLTMNGDSLINPFPGAPGSSLQANKSGGSGFTVSGGSFGVTQGTASYSAALTATTGNWDLAVSYFLGSTQLVGVDGSFVVGDPPPSISSVIPNQWTAGDTNFKVTISGSYFGSNPQLTVVNGGATASITSHSDTGLPAGAGIEANVSVPNACDAPGQAVITVTSTGYNGTGFGPAYAGEPSSAGATATIVPVAVRLAATLDPPQILFQSKNVAGQTTTVVVGQQISLTGKVPAQACVQVQSWNWTPPDGTAVGGAAATMTSGFTLKALPANSANPYSPFYWVYPGTFNVSVRYTLANGLTSPPATATFTVKGGGTMSNKPYSQLTMDDMKGCNGTPMLAYGKLVPGITDPCAALYPGSTFGIKFTPSGAQSGGTYSYVQLIESDSDTRGSLRCTSSQGVDGAYPYTSFIPNSNPRQAVDVPYLPLGGFHSGTRDFKATMFLLWTPPPPSIPVPLGYQTWGFSGSATCPTGANCTLAKNWTPKTSGTPGPIGIFTPSNGSQTTDGYTPLDRGYPVFAGRAVESCH